MQRDRPATVDVRRPLTWRYAGRRACGLLMLCVVVCGLVGHPGHAPTRARADDAPYQPGSAADEVVAGRRTSTPSSFPGAARRLRQPVALVLVDRGRLLLAANRRSGTVSVIDTDRRQVVDEHPVADGLTDLVATGDDRCLLATDEARHQLLLLQRDGTALRTCARVDVAPYPVSVCVSPDGRRCCVASLWSRRLTFVEIHLPGRDLSNPQQARSAPRAANATDSDPRAGNPAAEVAALRVAGDCDLPFAPRRQVWLAGAQRLVVADAFGGHLAVIDPAQPSLESVREMPAHNIGGLLPGPDGQSLLVSQQLLNGRARTDSNDVHWGILMTNLLRILPLANVLDRSAALLRNADSVLLGEVGKAGGDPAGIALAPDGRYVVALSGIGQVAVSQPDQAIQYRLPAGVRPTAVLAASAGSIAFVADALGDAVHVLDVVAGETQAAISLGPQPEPTAATRGERLFYNARLSHDGWMSCHSCHIDGHTNGLLNDNLGDGSFDAPKRVLSLLGVGDTAPWAWDGSATELTAQIRKSVVSTMLGRPLPDGDVDDLAAYLRTLQPPPVADTRADAASIERGAAVFRERGCRQCHAPSTFTSAGTYDVGFSDELGQAQFNPPSLRGVRHRDRLFHDNRAHGLEDAFTRHLHQLDAPLPASELADLIAYLRSL